RHIDAPHLAEVVGQVLRTVFQVIAGAAITRRDVKVVRLAWTKADPAGFVVVAPLRLRDRDHGLSGARDRDVRLNGRDLVDGDLGVKRGLVYIVDVETPIGREVRIEGHA